MKGQAALTREQGLADSFQARLDTMRGDTSSATDLTELKCSIDEHLDTLVRSMKDINNEGQLASGERDARLLPMTSRLQELENESKQARSQLETQRRLALTDGLTGLANRKALDERLNEEISIAVQRFTPIAVALAHTASISGVLRTRCETFAGSEFWRATRGRRIRSRESLNPSNVLRPFGANR
jgi:hypothetical protein